MMRRRLCRIIGWVLLRRQTSERQRGQTLMMTAVAFALIVGFAALTIDVGLAYIERRDAQNAADAAALAAAGRLLQGGSLGQAITEAQTWAAKNGFQNGVNNVSVTINAPPASGSQAGDSNYIEVAIGTRADAAFAGVFGINFWNVQARAVAGITSQPKNYAIITLHPTACRSLEVVGNAEIEIEDGGLLVNSSCPSDAFYVQGNAEVETEVNDVVGGWRFVGNVEVTPDPTLTGPIEDPLAGLPVPSPPNGPVQTCPNLNGNGSYTFQPGVYNCTINPNGNWALTFAAGDYLIAGGINLNGNINVTFQRGIYILGGSGFRVTGNADLMATEAMFYIDEGCLYLRGNSDLDFEAPRSGTYEGIAFFQNRANTCLVDLNGNATAGNWGTLYAAAAPVQIYGNTESSFQFIVNTLKVYGNSEIEIDFEDNLPASAPRLRLVE